MVKNQRDEVRNENPKTLECAVQRGFIGVPVKSFPGEEEERKKGEESERQSRLSLGRSSAGTPAYKSERARVHR